MTGEEFPRVLVRVQIHLWAAADAALRKNHDLPLARYLPMRVISETAPRDLAGGQPQLPLEQHRHHVEQQPAGACRTSLTR